MCFVWIWEQTAIIFLYNINWQGVITETQCVYCAVRTGYIFQVSVSLRRVNNPFQKSGSVFVIEIRGQYPVDLHSWNGLLGYITHVNSEICFQNTPARVGNKWTLCVALALCGLEKFCFSFETCLSLRHVLSDVSCCLKCSHRHILCVARPSLRLPADMKVSLVLQLLSATVALCAAEDIRLGWENRLWVCVICDGSGRVTRVDCGVGTPDSFTYSKTAQLVDIPVRWTSEFV